MTRPQSAANAATALALVREIGRAPLNNGKPIELDVEAVALLEEKLTLILYESILASLTNDLTG